MTIKQQGGVFGRNPTFNDATVEDLTVTNSVSVPNDSISGDAINGGTATPTKLLVNTTTNPNNRDMRFFGITEFDSAGATVVTFLSSSGATTLGAIGQGNYVVTGAPSNSFGIRSNVNLPIAAGGLTKVADFTANGLAFVDGKGIDFSATAGTGTSELFDDYEEGTFTVTTAGDATGAFSAETGEYTKIGNVVYVRIALLISANFTSNKIGGLPFTPVIDASATGLASMGVALTQSTGSAPIIAAYRNGQTDLEFYTSGSQGAAHLLNTTNSYYRFQGFYFV